MPAGPRFARALRRRLARRCGLALRCSPALRCSLALLTALAVGAGAATARGMPPPQPGVPQAPAEARRAPAVEWIDGVVAYVYDGDSFRLRTADGEEIGVRIAGIDAPERTQPFANVSRKALQEAIGARAVRVEAIKRDAFGRTVGRVFAAGRDVGLGQLEHGLAWHFARYDADLPPAERERYTRAQADAQEQRAGLWQQNDPLAPWLFRRQRR